jgi:hypothetical protein
LGHVAQPLLRCIVSLANVRFNRLSDRGLLVERTSSNDKSRSDNRSSNDKSDRSGKSRQLDGYTVDYHPYILEHSYLISVYIISGPLKSYI